MCSLDGAGTPICTDHLQNSEGKNCLAAIPNALFTPDEYSAETVNSAEHLTSLNAQSSTRPNDRPSELRERVNRNRSYLLGWVDTPTTCSSVLAHILGLSEQVSTSVEWRAHLQLWLRSVRVVLQDSLCIYTYLFGAVVMATKWDSIWTLNFISYVSQ